jgi:hypothetical protein
MLAAALGERLVERFDEDWFRNPAAGPALRAMFASERARDPDSLAVEWGGTADAGAVVRLAERTLG